MWSTYNGTTFTAPTLDYLYEIGVASENSAMQAERIKQEAETVNDPNSVV
jgi:hypothetical protein